MSGHYNRPRPGTKPRAFPRPRPGAKSILRPNQENYNTNNNINTSYDQNSYNNYNDTSYNPQNTSNNTTSSNDFNDFNDFQDDFNMNNNTNNNNINSYDNNTTNEFIDTPYITQNQQQFEQPQPQPQTQTSNIKSKQRPRPRPKPKQIPNVQGSTNNYSNQNFQNQNESENKNSNLNYNDNNDNFTSRMQNMAGNAIGGNMGKMISSGMAGEMVGGVKNAVFDELQKNVGIDWNYVNPGMFNLNYYKYYFHVNNKYVLNKLKYLLLPILRKNVSDWKRISNNDNGNNHTPRQGPTFNSPYKTAVDDINAPDGYLPLMAIITYIVIMGFLTGSTQGHAFSPQILLNTASSACVGLIIEVILTKVGFYVIAGVMKQPIFWLDLVCYAGYKLVFVTLNLMIFLLIDSLIVYYIVSIGTGILAAVFMIQTMRPYFRSFGNNMSSSFGSLSNVLKNTDQPQNTKRIFLAGVGLFQIGFILLMGQSVSVS